ncbi:MAG: ATP-binding cassette domain-containing protein [Candidatus Taylorbacteria bacterium]
MSKGQKSVSNEFSGDTIIRFEDVSFEYGHNKPILEEASFTVRRGTKITLMGQNGAGKTTIFGLILGANDATSKDVAAGIHKPEAGEIHLANNATIATARQVIPRPDLELTVREFFAKALESGGRAKVYDIDPRIDAILEVVNLHAPKPTPKAASKSSSKSAAGHIDLKDRHVKTFSGGQQARLLLASALIQDPDILLLDEPTNNLDKAGIEHLTQFLVDYKKTCLVISHDADFLNAFTHGVLYLDLHTRKVEQYVGDYKDVVEQISARIEKENMENARLVKEIEAKKYQAGVFANKGGQMRLVAKRMREKADELEEEIVDVRKEDKTIRDFTIPSQFATSHAGQANRTAGSDIVGDIIHIKSYSILDLKTHKPVKRTCNIKLRRKQHLLLAGPNGIGKSTLLEAIVNGGFDDHGMKIAGESIITEGVRVGYYRQDFSMMDFNDTVYESLEKIVRSVEGRLIETEVRAVAASFLIGADAIHTRIGSLSEGQKGLVAFARLVLLKPGLLILDEPTNHINFRHIPVIARALDKYEGAMILVSHVPEFVEKVRIDEVLDLGK